MLIRITAPHFVAGIDYPKYYAPIVKYMEGWSLDRIFRYCWNKGWDARVIETEGESVVERYQSDKI